MGFYSFYRIFKDIIKTLFGNKAFKYFLIFAIICIIVLFANKTFAVEPGNYVVDYYTTGYTAHSQDLTGYWYWFIPVFANSSYSISWPSGTELSFGFIDNLTRLVNTGYSFDIKSFNVIQSNNQGSYGYFAVKDGYLVVVQREYDFPNKVNLSITTDYDFTSNLATIHQDLRDFLYGSDTSMNYTYKSSFIATMSGVFANNDGYDLVYFPVSKGYKYSLSFDCLDLSTNRWARHGYSSVVPSNGANYDNLTSTLFNQPSNLLEVTATQDGYYYFCFVKGLYNNFSLNSNYVEGMEGGINQQIINQGTETRDTLTDSNISQDNADYTLPTDSTNDITQEGFNSIFERIRSTFTSGSSTPIVVTIPFTNKSFTISYDTVYGSANLGLVRSIIESFWWFVISLFITKDIFKKIEKIKTGNIEFTETANIKEDIL